MINYFFDVDGTLTCSRKKIDKSFEFFFGEWVNHQQEIGNKVFLITGSDKKKTLSQIGLALYRLVDGVYQNSGNQLCVRNTMCYEKHWAYPQELIIDLEKIASKSRWFGRAEKNIEIRIGEYSNMPMMINFSTVGRSADSVLRREYYNWDNKKEERKSIVHELSNKYPAISFSVGGEISIDIMPKGRDKSQALGDMKEGENIFIGDRCGLGGNDFEIATMSDKHYNVESWEQTNEILIRLLPKNS